MVSVGGLCQGKRRGGDKNKSSSMGGGRDESALRTRVWTKDTLKRVEAQMRLRRRGK